MQFQTKRGLVDIPNEQILAAADTIRGSVRSDQRSAFDAMEAEQREEHADYVRRCGGIAISKIKP